MRISYRLAYDGLGFAGFQRQPNRFTVEGELFRAFRALGVDPAKREHHYQCAGRTDQGVHAFAQTFAMSFNLQPAPRIRAVNAQLPKGVYIWAESEVSEQFSPRYDAISREYRYFFVPKPTEDIDVMRQVSRLFIGRHDFRGFARVEKGHTPIRDIIRCDLVASGPIISVIVEGDSFLWNQVRRMVAAIRLAGDGRLAQDSIIHSLETGMPPGMGIPATNPGGLVLTEIKYPVTWQVDDYTLRHLEQYWLERMDCMGSLWGASAFFSSPLKP